MTRNEAIKEAMAIAVAQEALNARFHNCIEALRSDNPEFFVDSTDFMFKPDAIHAGEFAHYLTTDKQIRMRRRYHPNHPLPAWLTK